MSQLLGVDRSVDLDAELRSGAKEIQNVGTQGVLALEVKVLTVAPKQRPQRLLRLRHGATQRLARFWVKIGARKVTLPGQGRPLHHATRGSPPP